MTFSTLQAAHTAIRFALLATYRAGGRIQTGVMKIYRGAGRLQTALSCHRGTGRFASVTDYRGSEHGICGIWAVAAG